MAPEITNATRGTLSHKVYQSPVVRLVVGTEKTPFDVHRDLLCHYSSYFRGALTGDFKEAKELRIVLDEEIPQVIELFVRFCYTQTLYDPQEIKRRSEEWDERTDVSLPQSMLVNLWTFGDRRGVPALQNMSIDAFHRHMCQSRSLDRRVISPIYADTTRGAKLRDLIVERFATVGREVQTEDEFAVVTDFLIEVIKRYHELRPIGAFDRREWWKNLDLCRFHIHQGVTDCKGRDVVSSETSSSTYWESNVTDKPR